MKWLLCGTIVLTILTLSFASALPTLYNPFTGKLDYYGNLNDSNLNVNNSVYWNGNNISFLTDNYVPYNNATKNIELGAYYINSTSFIKAGLIYNATIGDDANNFAGIFYFPFGLAGIGGNFLGTDYAGLFYGDSHAAILGTVSEAIYTLGNITVNSGDIVISGVPVSNWLYNQTTPAEEFTINNFRNKSDEIDWTNLTNYPVPCPDGYFVSTINDSTICTTLNLSNYSVWLYNQSDGSFNSSYTPYTGATNNIDTGIYNLTTNHLTVHGGMDVGGNFIFNSSTATSKFFMSRLGSLTSEYSSFTMSDNELFIDFSQDTDENGYHNIIFNTLGGQNHSRFSYLFKVDNIAYLNITNNGVFVKDNISTDTYFGKWNGSTDYVPYTGANQNINFGFYNLTTNKIFWDDANSIILNNPNADLIFNRVNSTIGIIKFTQNDSTLINISRTGEVYINKSLTVPRMGIGTDASPLSATTLDVIGRVRISSTDAVNSAKFMYLRGLHYNLTEKDVLYFFGSSDSQIASTVRYGGGSASYNAVVQQLFYTGKNATHLVGDVSMYLNNSVLNTTNNFVVGGNSTIFGLGNFKDGVNITNNLIVGGNLSVIGNLNVTGCIIYNSNTTLGSCL